MNKKQKYIILLLILVPLHAMAQKSSTSTSTNMEDEDGQSEHITVKGQRQADGSAAVMSTPEVTLGPLGSMNAEDAPFSIMSVPHDVMVNQQARNVNDLMKYLPSVQLEARGSAGMARPQSRGFEGDVTANSRIDGLNITTTTPYPAEMFESLQVLNGLAGAMYGPQNPAGIFSYQLKRPTDRRMEHLEINYDSIGAVTGYADVSGRTGKNDWFGYRLNLLHDEGTAYVDHSYLKRDLVSGDFDFHLSSKTVLEIDASHYIYNERGTATNFSFDNSIQLPSAPNMNKAYLGQKYAGFNTETNTFLGKIKHQINEKWRLTFGGLYQDAKREMFNNSNRLLNSAGDYQQTISVAGQANVFKVGSNFGYVNGEVNTDFIKHDLVLGTNGYIRGNYNPTHTETISLGTSNIYNPRPLPGRKPKGWGQYQSATVQQQALIAGDTIHFNKHWAIMGVFSWSWLSSDSWNVKKVKTAQNTHDAAFSPTTSLIYHPIEGHTAYFTWARSLQAGDTAPATGVTNPNQVMAPYRSEEYEVGYKVKFNRLWLNVAAFRMTRPYAFINPTSHVFAVAGQQRNYGVEFQAAGQLWDNLSILGGVTWLDAQLGKTGDIATSNKQIVGVPPVQVNFLIDYQLPVAKDHVLYGMAFNINLHYTDRRAANNYNTTFAKGYFTTDMGVRYPFRVCNIPLAARFNVNNVTNKHYWMSVYPSSINGGTANNSAYAGLPRTYQGSLTVDF